MKTLFSTVVLLLGLGAIPAHSSSVVGEWSYDGFFYDGHRYPNPNPDLSLTFTFRENGISRLYWERTDESGFCEREALYELRGEFLYQKVIWLNPKNLPSCSKDPDMHMGQETESRFEVNTEELRLFFDLNGKEFIYILKSATTYN